MEVDDQELHPEGNVADDEDSDSSDSSDSDPCQFEESSKRVIGDDDPDYTPCVDEAVGADEHSSGGDDSDHADTRKRKMPQVEGGARLETPLGREIHIEVVNVGNIESEYGDSDCLETLGDSDEDEQSNKRKQYPESSQIDSHAPPVMVVGMSFPSHTEFRKLLKHYVISNRIAISYNKNERKHIDAQCKNRKRDPETKEWTGCEWRVYASWSKDQTFFQIKSFNSTCNCPKVNHNSVANSSWYAQRFLEQMRDDPDWKANSMKKTVKRELALDASTQQMYRARKKALQCIDGIGLKQFENLWDYTHILRELNPGSVIKMKVKRYGNDEVPTFQRLFIAYQACLKGFAEGAGLLLGWMGVTGGMGCQ